MNKNEYLIDAFKKLGKSQSEIISDLNKSQPYVSALMNGKKSVGKDVAKQLSELYGFDFGSILSGEGDMLKSDEGRVVKLPKQEVSQVPESDYMEVEYADLRTSAGSLGAVPVEQLPDTHKRLIPKEYASGKYLVARVEGDSMNDGTDRSICDGDEILIKEYIKNNGDVIPFRTHLFVISSNEGDVVKQIVKHDVENGIITCHSFNPSWKDYEIHLGNVFSLFTVEKIVNRKIKF